MAKESQMEYEDPDKAFGDEQDNLDTDGKPKLGRGRGRVRGGRRGRGRATQPGAKAASSKPDGDAASAEQKEHEQKDLKRQHEEPAEVANNEKEAQKKPRTAPKLKRNISEPLQNQENKQAKPAENLPTEDTTADKDGADERLEDSVELFMSHVSKFMIITSIITYSFDFILSDMVSKHRTTQVTRHCSFFWGGMLDTMCNIYCDSLMPRQQRCETKVNETRDLG